MRVDLIWHYPLKKATCIHTSTFETLVVLSQYTVQVGERADLNISASTAGRSGRENGGLVLKSQETEEGSSTSPWSVV